MCKSVLTPRVKVQDLEHAFPIDPIPTIPKVNPVGSLAGTTPGAALQLPERALFSALVVFLNTARVKNIAMSAVASATASTVLQNQILSSAIQLTSNSLNPALADVIMRQSGTRADKRSLSNGSYGGVPMRMMNASMGPYFLMLAGSNSLVSFRFAASNTE